MKIITKFIKYILTFALAFSSIQSNLGLQILAEEETKTVGLTEMGCSVFEVDYANADGTFTVIECKDNYEDAKALMDSKEEDNVVVRGEASLSPMKIIAMKSGIAASYAFREASGNSVAVTANVYQYNTKVDNEKQTYVTSHRELAYVDTPKYTGDNSYSYAHVILSGFDGYIKLSQVDLIPQIFIDNNVKVVLGGNCAVENYEEPFYIYVHRSYFTVEQDGNYTSVIYHFSSMWANQKTGTYQPESYSYAIGPAADWMNVGDMYYSNDFENFYKDNKYTDYAGKYYSYYEYLPLRSQSNITSEIMENYLKAKGYTTDNSVLVGNTAAFITGQNTYGVNALLVFAMACLESGYGTSKIAKEKYNLFGWAAVDSDPNDATKYTSVEASILQQMNYNLRKYLDVNSAVYFGSHLGNKGSGFNVKYASDPYWGVKIASIAYEIDKFANGNSGNLTDYNYYQVAILNASTNVKKSADANSTTLFNTAYGSTYEKNFTAIINEVKDGWIQIPTSNGFTSKGEMVTASSEVQKYEWKYSVGYVSQDAATVIYTSKYSDSVLAKPGMIQSESLAMDIVNKTDELTLTSTGISINGAAYQPGFNVLGYENISHNLVLSNDSGDTKIQLNNVRYGTELTDVKGLDYTDSGYTISDCSITNLAVGTYTLTIETTVTNGSVSMSKSSNIVADKLTTDVITIGNHTYQFKTDGTKTTLTKTLVKQSSDAKLVNTLKEFSWNDDNTLHIAGIAYIRGMDNNDDKLISKTLKVLDVDTEEVVKSYTLTNVEKKIDLLDGYDYTYAWYSADLDISDLPAGNYKFKVEVTVDGVSKASDLKSSSTSFLIDEKQLIKDAEYFCFTENVSYQYRIELNITPNLIYEDSATALPSRRPSVVSLQKVEFNDDSLSLDGLAYIRYISYDKDKTVSNQLILENQETHEVVTYDIKSNACALNYTSLFSSSNDLTNICMSDSVDLGTLANGTYNVYFKLVNQGDDKNYSDVIVLKASRSDVSYSNESYTLKPTGYNNRYLLTVNRAEDSNE